MTDKIHISLEKLFREIPILAIEKECSLARKWQESRDILALQEIVLAHGRMAVAMAREFRRFGLPESDLVQEAGLGLLEAAYRFDPGNGARFSTYAAFWIRAALQKYAFANWSVVRPAATREQKARFFNLSPESAPDISLTPPAGDGPHSIASTLADAGPTPEESFAAAEEARQQRAHLDSALARLAPREREIIRLRHVSNDPPTLATIGESWGISKERARQIESQALGKLRRHLTDFYLPVNPEVQPLPCAKSPLEAPSATSHTRAPARDARQTRRGRQGSSIASVAEQP